MANNVEPLSKTASRKDRHTMRIETISEKEHFYGYIIGLHVEPCDGLEIGTRLYATFEYGNGTQIWRVPDAKLFEILSSHLNSMAESRHAIGEYGYSKLWIEKKNGKWHVDLP